MFRRALDALDVLAKLKAAGVALHMIGLGGDTIGNGDSKLVFTILWRWWTPSGTARGSEAPR